jgi:hypothetical protein
VTFFYYFIFDEWFKCTSVPDPYVFEPVGSSSGSVSQKYGAEDPHPDPYQNVTDPQHCLKVVIFVLVYAHILFVVCNTKLCLGGSIDHTAVQLHLRL